ncbi:hypothetical protein [Ruminococcus sp.]|uniref:hypothetical protein n=1 Tax=Ruminococcus sp. TaxID=41978 RepID=UPI0025D9CEA5|nr:hypothetical protein [Ruminococcus sp.]MBQ8965756.1 hypothetical protein [Ruminococcus sp.]
MKTRFKSQRKGAVLMTVLVVSVMMVVIVAAAISLVAHTNTRTNDEYRKKQAYFAASSTLKAFVSETTNITTSGGASYTEVAAAIDRLQDIADDNTEVEVRYNKINSAGVVGGDISVDNPRWNDITCTMKVERISESSLKAISHCEYLGEEATVVAYLAIKPLEQSAYVPNALELIGTDGGNSSGGYNNINVYGNTGTPDIESHNKNIVYNFGTNGNSFYGDISILGTGLIATNFRLKQNPYYVAGVTTDVTPGCTLNVSHSLFLANNTPQLTSTMYKSQDASYDVEPVGVNGYNYINCMDAFVCTTNNAVVGSPASNGTLTAGDAKMVDIYASRVHIGERTTELMAACVNGANSTEYNNKINAVGSGQGQDNSFYGNIYTYDKGGYFNGDIYISGINNKFYGDIYASGDVYINCSYSQLGLYGTLYLRDGKKLYNYGVEDNTDLGGHVVRLDSAHDWLSDGKRKKRPQTPERQVVPYYYLPEHLLCEPGNSSVKVSTIHNTYASFYDNVGDGDGTNDTIAAGAKRLSQCTNTSGTTYTNNGITVTPDYIVKESCVIDKTMSGTIMIDLDDSVENLDGRHDIVMLMLDNTSPYFNNGYGGQFVNDSLTRVFVNCSEDPESDNARFCYFVSDSGYGSTRNEYGENLNADPKVVSTYTANTFKTSNVDCGNGKWMLMDFTTYCHSGYANSINALNPTARDCNDPIYNMSTGNIMILMTHGCKLKIGQESVLQATVFMPEATLEWTNNAYNEGGRTANIEPSHSIWPSDTSMSGNGITEVRVNILGSVIVNHFDASANDNTIVYQQVSTKSMVAITHGIGEQRADESFQLINYSYA